jgi:HD-like signal output (HDOD) protein
MSDSSTLDPSAISQEKIDAILRGTTIPSPPQVIVDLQMEMAMPDPDLNAMTKIISGDAGLAGGVLKTINSGIYGGGAEITSISKAVMLLGMNTLMRIINTLSLRNEVMNMEDVPDHLFAAMNGFWDSASDVANSCVFIAQRLSFEHPDQAYALGLFHNVGIPLLMMKYDNYAAVISESYANPSPRIVDTENQMIDTNHAVIGFFVARSWKLPSNLCDLISQHHNVEIFQNHQSLENDNKTLLAILKMAEHVSGLYRSIGGQPNNIEWNHIGKDILEYVGLSSVDFEDIISQAHDSGLGQQQYFM